MFASLMEPYAMIPESITYQMGRNVAPIFYLFRRNRWQPLADPRLKNTASRVQLSRHHFEPGLLNHKCERLQTAQIALSR